MKDLDLTTLRLFVAVCDSRSIVRVAERENTVASAISKRLARLEADLGIPLLRRIRRGVEPTAAGDTLREHARGLLAAAQRVSDDMSSYSLGASGLVRLAATTSSIAESLPDDIAAFLQQAAHRAIRVNVQEQVSREVVRSLRDGSVSLGICWDAADLAGLQTLPYRQDQLAIVTDENHALARHKKIAFVDSLDYEHVALPAATAVQLMLARAAAAAGRTLQYRAEVSTFEAALRVVRSGLGICVVPREVALPLAAAFRLSIVPLTDSWARRRFVICFQNEHTLSPAAKLLARHLGEAARPA
jgi:DNA-binding transcriptional LysR family regulator